MMLKTMLKEWRLQVTWMDRDKRKSEESQLCMDRGLLFVLVDEKWTLDETGKLIDCAEKRAESDIAKSESASAAGRPKQEENERIELEDLFISHMS